MRGLIFIVKKIASLILTHIWLLMRFRQNFVSLQSILGGAPFYEAYITDRCSSGASYRRFH